MPSIPMVNGQRIDATRITLGGVPAWREHTKAIAGVPAGSLVAAPLRLNGEVAGSPDLNVDGSATPALFWIAGATALLTTIARVSILLADAAIVEAGFGGLAALTNGLALDVTDDAGAALVDLTGGLALKSHADLLALGADLRFIGATMVAVAWDLATPVELVAGQRLRATVRDNLTGLTRATIVAAGETRSST